MKLVVTYISRNENNRDSIHINTKIITYSYRPIFKNILQSYYAYIFNFKPAAFSWN